MQRCLKLCESRCEVLEGALQNVSARAAFLLNQGWVESFMEFKLISYGNLFNEFIIKSDPLCVKVRTSFVLLGNCLITK